MNILACLVFTAASCSKSSLLIIPSEELSFPVIDANISVAMAKYELFEQLLEVDKCYSSFKKFYSSVCEDYDLNADANCFEHPQVQARLALKFPGLLRVHVERILFADLDASSYADSWMEYDLSGDHAAIVSALTGQSVKQSTDQCTWNASLIVGLGALYKDQVAQFKQICGRLGYPKDTSVTSETFQDERIQHITLPGPLSLAQFEQIFAFMNKIYTPFIVRPLGKIPLSSVNPIDSLICGIIVANSQANF